VDPAGPGEVLPSVLFEVPVRGWTGQYVVRVDDDAGRGVIGECDESDNEIRGSAELCP
jgi:hypothetical protein